VQKLARLQFHTLLDFVTQTYFSIFYIYGHKLYPVLYHFTCNEVLHMCSVLGVPSACVVKTFITRDDVIEIYNKRAINEFRTFYMQL